MRQISYAEEFPVTYAECCPLGGSPFLVWAVQSDFLWKNTAWKGERNSDLTAKQYDKYAFNQMIKVKINSGE